MGYFKWAIPPYINKWHTFVASIYLELFFGSAYSFPLWGPLLKSTFDLNQAQLQLIASSANVAGTSAILGGLVYDAMDRHKRVGPRLVLLLGLCFNAAGYLGLWAAVSGRFEASIGQLAVLAAVAANGSTWPDTSALVTNVRNFPSSRGSVLAALKACIALSGPLFACLYSGLFASPDRAAAFLLFLALGPVAVGLLALPFINHCSFVQASELEPPDHRGFTTEGRFAFALQSLGVLAVYLIGATTLESLLPLTQLQRLALTAGAALLLLPLLVVPWGSGGLLSKRAQLHHHLALYSDSEEEEEEEEEEEGDGVGVDGEGADVAHAELAGAGSGTLGAERGVVPSATVASTGRGRGSSSKGSDLQQPLLEPPNILPHAARSAGGAAPATGAAAAAAPVAKAGAKAASKQRVLPEVSPLECLGDFDFWLLFLVCAIGTGAGLTLLNNLAQLAAALGGVPSSTPVLLALFGVANCGGRMLLGHIPERLLHSRGTPRLLFLPLMSALMSLACLAMALARLPLLYPVVALTGFAYGGHWALIPAIVSELFGLKRFAANLALMMVAPAGGSFALAMGLASWQYQRAIARHGTTSNTCKGQDCFQLTFVALALLLVAAAGLGALLYRRRRGLYRLEYHEVHTYDEEIAAH